MVLLSELSKCDLGDQFMGVLECNLLSHCNRKLNVSEVGQLVQKLNYNLLDVMKLDVGLLHISKLVIEDSPRKPK
jgi:hypothetical protein